MLFNVSDQYPWLQAYWEKYLPYQKRIEVPARTVLLPEGKRSQHYRFIEKGCIRSYIQKNGEDKTVQFFFEKDGILSFDSFINNIPSAYTLATIEPSIIYSLHRKYVMQLIQELSQEPDFVTMILQVTARRQMHYANEFVSVLRDTPEQRYQRLLKERPYIIQRVPQHYIASYLGVSPVHLSRIKSKLAKGKAHF